MIHSRWTILSVLAILELQSSHAFVLPSSFPPARRSTPERHPIGFTTFQPASSNSRPRLLAPAEAVVEEAKQSVLSRARTVLSPLLLSLRNAAAPALAIASANEWPINLAKHVLTMISVKFVVSTIIDVKRETKFRWTQLPRYIAAAGLMVSGALWIDSIFLVPYYVINLLKHVACMGAVVSVVSFIRSRQTRTNVTTAVAEPLPPPSKSVPTPRPPPVIVVEEPAGVIAPVNEDEGEAKIDEDLLVIEEDKPTKSDQVADAKEKVNEVVKNRIYYLTHLQDELADIQLKRIPDFFSQESYERAQERITNFQSGKLLDFFREEDVDEEEKNNP